jgi:hypothetical protein
MATMHPESGGRGPDPVNPRPCDVLARAKRTAGVRFNVRRRVAGAFENLRAYGRQEELSLEDQRCVVTAFQLLWLPPRLPNLHTDPAPPSSESLEPA